jgi:hypothetical protein
MLITVTRKMYIYNTKSSVQKGDGVRIGVRKL